ncbi:Hypothetical predicted protein [Scomber scombrus]|uniref:Uncharacterized protein n=1 Tax=Scomber scombrus TaxID=13677 RepID=A0AAV1P9S3_SCOSC
MRRKRRRRKASMLYLSPTPLHPYPSILPHPLPPPPSRHQWLRPYPHHLRQTWLQPLFHPLHLTPLPNPHHQSISITDVSVCGCAAIEV